MRVRGELDGRDVRDAAESAAESAAAFTSAAVHRAAAVRDAAESAAKISSTTTAEPSESERIIAESSFSMF